MYACALYRKTTTTTNNKIHTHIGEQTQRTLWDVDVERGTIHYYKSWGGGGKEVLCSSQSSVSVVRGEIETQCEVEVCVCEESLHVQVG